MTETQLAKLERDLERGAKAYSLFQRAVIGSIIGDAGEIERIEINMRRIRDEIFDAHESVANRPGWLRDFKP